MLDRCAPYRHDPFVLPGQAEPLGAGVNTVGMTDSILDALVHHVRSTRQAERDIFGALDPAVRDRPMRPGDWSPKDHQAHLSAWKARQADRFAAIRNGREPLVDEREDDVVNAELHATRADWAWPDVEREADEISQRLESEIAAMDPDVLAANERLIGGTFGNGPFHAITHFGWLTEAGVGVDESRLDAFMDEQEQQLRGEALAERDRGTGLYNLACAHALAGRLDRARSLLREGFALRPDMREFAAEDPDLEELRDELSDLAPSAAT